MLKKIPCRVYRLEAISEDGTLIHRSYHTRYVEAIKTARKLPKGSWEVTTFERGGSDWLHVLGNLDDLPSKLYMRERYGITRAEYERYLKESRI